MDEIIQHTWTGEKERLFDLLRTLGGAEGGQSLIETAFVLPAFFTMLFGFFNVTFVIFGICNANYAADAATRFASVHSSTSLAPATLTDVQNSALANLKILGSGTPTVSAFYVSGGDVVGGVIGVTISYPAAAGMAFKNFTVKAESYRVITR